MSFEPFPLNAEQSRRLQLLGFPRGLRTALAHHTMEFAQRIWILDNSGSMAIGDGHRVVETADGKVQGQAVTRWEELQQAVLFHAELSATLSLQAHFRLLNHPGEAIGVQEFTICDPSRCEHSGTASTTTTTTTTTTAAHDLAQELRVARNIIQRTKPAGVTPLTDHLLHIERIIRLFREELLASGKRVTLVVCTDGLPTDHQGEESLEVNNEFIRALQQMEDLPIWIVIRLCTSDPHVTDFYNQLDTQLELGLEVLDDHTQEAKEVRLHNKWLTYGLPIHRCRELGFQHRLFDLLDERPLTSEEMQHFCGILFGEDIVNTWPNVATRPKDFGQAMQDYLQTYEREQWDPAQKKMAPWINVRLLLQTYGGNKKAVAAQQQNQQQQQLRRKEAPSENNPPKGSSLRGLFRSFRTKS